MNGSDFSELSADAMLAISRLCDEFESAWQTGGTPRVEDFLGKVEPQLATPLLRELIPLEINYRRQAGASVSRDEYAVRFPNIASDQWERLFEAAATLVERPPSTPTVESAEPPAALPKVLGDYEIVGLIGSGGMGSVYKAIHQRMGRTVALKVLRSEIQRDPALLKRFDREVRAAARLIHPNIVTALDAREHEGVHFLITEFVEGIDLSARVRQSGALDLLDAIDCVLQAARGLDYAHRQGIIHRDIKPANLLIDETKRVRILDMGLARLDVASELEATQLTRSGMVMGTAEFMAPEQARDTRKADERSDIYSLGCTLFFLLTGRLMYKGETVVDTILSHVSQPIPSLARHNSRVPKELDQIFQKMVAKSPEDRFQSAADVVGVLERFQRRYAAALRNATEGARKAGTGRPREETRGETRKEEGRVDGGKENERADGGIERGRVDGRKEGGDGRGVPVGGPRGGPVAPPIKSPVAPPPVSPAVMPDVAPVTDPRFDPLGLPAIPAHPSVPVPPLVTSAGGRSARTSTRTRPDSRPLYAALTLVALLLVLGGGYWGYSFISSSGNVPRPVPDPALAQNGGSVPRTPPFQSQPTRPGESSPRETTPGTIPRTTLPGDATPGPRPTPMPAPTPSTLRSGLRFNGQSSYVEVASLLPTAGGSYTLEAFVELETPRTSNVISWLGPDWMALYVSPDQGWGVARREAGTSVLYVADRPAELGRPVHLAATFEPGNPQLFVDGQLAAGRTANGGLTGATFVYELPETQGGLFIGGVREDRLPMGQNDRFFAGVVRAARISRGVLYRESFAVPVRLRPDSETLALFEFSEERGTETRDSSAANHLGTIVDAEWLQGR